MSPRTRADHLTEEQLGELSSALAEGRRATVYLVDGIPSLGIDPGASARVISVTGTTVMVRPKGVDDELPFESDELRLTRQPAGAPAKKAAAATPAPARSAVSSSPKPRTPEPVASVARPSATQPVTPKPVSRSAPARSVPAERVEEKKPVNDTNPGPSAAAKPKAPARKAKKAPTISITVTIDPESEWTVGIAHGTRKVGKPSPVAPDAVERAVKELGDPGAIEAVQSVIDAARTAAEERVAQLSRELEEARKALESLGATPKTGTDL